MRKPRPPIDPARRARLLHSVTYASVSMAICLVLAKAWAWWVTDSVAMLSSLADSFLDCLASALTFWAVRYSMSPADTEHRFGHGKSEGVAALIQGLVITGSGLFVCFEAIRRFITPQAIEELDAGLFVIGAATVATIVLVSYQRYVSWHTGSVAIRADAMHYSTDLIANLGVGAALVVSAKTGWFLLDPLVGLAIGGYVLLSSMKIISQALEILLDHEIPDADRCRVQQIALEHPDVLGLHDMRTRHGGSHYIMQFHLDLPPNISLWRSHEIMDDVEMGIRREYPDCEIIIHADPHGIEEPKDPFETAICSLPGGPGSAKACTPQAVAGQASE